jgi:hypothetical protein
MKINQWKTKIFWHKNTKTRSSKLKSWADVRLQPEIMKWPCKMQCHQLLHWNVWEGDRESRYVWWSSHFYLLDIIFPVCLGNWQRNSCSRATWFQLGRYKHHQSVKNKNTLLCPDQWDQSLIVPSFNLHNRKHGTKLRGTKLSRDKVIAVQLFVGVFLTIEFDSSSQARSVLLLVFRWMVLHEKVSDAFVFRITNSKFNRLSWNLVY